MVSPRSKALSLTATAIGTCITALAGSMVNTALPSIARDFHITAADSVWVVNAQQLANTSTLLFLAAAGDARGAKRVYLWGLSLYTLATLGCMLAPSFEFLVAMRVLQGIGGGALMVTVNTLNRAVFPPHMVGRSVAINSIFVAVGSAGGPTFGGLVLAFGTWQWIFAVNLPLAALSLYLAWRYLPRVAGSGARLDYFSAVLAALGFGGLIYALDGAARHMAASAVVAIAVVGIASMWIFVRRQFRLEHPMLAVELFELPVFSVSVLASMATYAALGLAYVVLPFYFQGVLGRTPFESGLLLSAWPISTLLVAVWMGPLSDRYPASLLCAIGISVMAAGIAGFAFMPPHPPTWALVACAALGGLGFATFQTPNNRAIIVSAPPAKTGRAAGVMAAARLSGMTTGAATVAIVFSFAGPAAAAGRLPPQGTIEAALLVAFGFTAVALLLSAIRLRSAEHVPA